MPRGRNSHMYIGLPILHSNIQYSNVAYLTGLSIPASELTISTAIPDQNLFKIFHI